MKNGLGLVLGFFIVFLILLIFLLSFDTFLDFDTCNRINYIQHGLWDGGFRLCNWDVHKLYDYLFYLLFKFLSFFGIKDPVIAVKFVTSFFISLYLAIAFYLSRKILQKRINSLYMVLLYSLGAPGIIFLFLTAEDNVAYLPFFMVFVYFFTVKLLKKEAAKTKIFLYAVITGLLLAVCMQINISSLIFLFLICLIPFFIIRKQFDVAAGLLIMDLSAIVFYYMFDFIITHEFSDTLRAYLTDAIRLQDISKVQKLSVGHLKNILTGFIGILFFPRYDTWLSPCYFEKNILDFLAGCYLIVWIVFFACFCYITYKFWQGYGIKYENFLIGSSGILFLTIIYPVLYESNCIERWDLFWITFIFIFVYLYDMSRYVIGGHIFSFISKLFFVIITLQVFWGIFAVLFDIQTVLKNPIASVTKNIISDVETRKNAGMDIRAVYLPKEIFWIRAYPGIMIPDSEIYYVEEDKQAFSVYDCSGGPFWKMEKKEYGTDFMKFLNKCNLQRVVDYHNLIVNMDLDLATKNNVLFNKEYAILQPEDYNQKGEFSFEIKPSDIKYKNVYLEIRAYVLYKNNYVRLYIFDKEILCLKGRNSELRKSIFINITDLTRTNGSVVVRGELFVDKNTSVELFDSRVEEILYIRAAKPSRRHVGADKRRRLV